MIDTPTDAQLALIDAATTGTISYSEGGGGSGGGNDYTVSDTTISASELNSLDNQYSGTVDATAVTTITGTAAEITTVYSSSGISGLGNEAITITDNHTLAQLKTINNATSGTITLNDLTVALSGSSADVAAALAGSFTSSYTGIVTITNADYTVAQLKAINNATTGVILLDAATTALSGSASDLVLAFAGTVTEHTGTVTITNADYTVAQLKAINNATTGAITLSTTNTALTGTAADLVLAFAGTVTEHTGNITITDADGTNIGAATTGTVTVTNAITITGTTAEMIAALVTEGTLVVVSDAAITLLTRQRLRN